MFKFIKTFIYKRVGYDCPSTEILKENHISKYSNKELISLKRTYCFKKCKHKCDELIMLKKIYWELKKLNNK